ncbi:MAG: polymer-forming cytoskeletal protein [Gemmatimonadetes bacterium]|nr:polymer-forming cytoskeletal protein [Gemmatimonadota bacterium]MBI3081439.1 polymer-forming cytoskeletal protein [Gemmatimonadota bacterium]
MSIFSSTEEGKVHPPKRTAASPQREPGLSVIAPGMRVEGELVTDGVVKIEGTVVGTVRAGQQVLVAKGGIVEGDIHTREAVLGGEVRGAILAHERVEVQATSVVHGDIGTQRIVVHEGGEVNGHLRMGDPRVRAEQEEDDGEVGAVRELPRPPAAAHS